MDILPKIKNISSTFRSKGASGFVDMLIDEALTLEASDIHIDPRSILALIQIRVNGELKPMYELERALMAECVGRIKILSKLRTDVHIKGQDGRFFFVLQNGERLDIRVSVMPTFYGENAVLRILRPTKQRVLNFVDLGMDQEQSQTLKSLTHANQGLVLIAGSTGSGKTTTTYAMCRMFISSGRNVVTIEDPVEYLIEGARQIQVFENHFGFSDALRAVLRQDPDVIVVGEIRDAETAHLAFRSALTGHLVIATIHAEGVFGVKGRLVDLGVTESMLSLLKLVIGQKLIPQYDEKKNLISRKGMFNFLEIKNDTQIRFKKDTNEEH